ncbi:MAG: DUF6502 family protein [Gammaproteobacteria bacterium]|jgi:hypothetical protein
MNDIPQILLSATANILKPLIKMLIRYGIGYAAFTDLAKHLYYEAGKDDFAIPGKKQTASRISTLTGLSRKEVARLEALPPRQGTLDASRINRAARVISGWVRDGEFQTDKQEPADLPFEGDTKSFSALVKRYSGDITARTIADELLRIDAISMSPDGLIHLNSRAYVANTSDADKVTILGTDVSHLIRTIDHNIANPGDSYFQRKVAYSYIPPDKLPGVKNQLTDIAQSSLEAMDKVLAKHAVRKSAAKKSVPYSRAGIGIYYFEGESS